MRSLAFGAVVFAVLLAVACKSEGVPADDGEKEPLKLRSEPFALDLMADPLPIETLEEIRGYDFEGGLACLPLQEETCIPRFDPVDEACNRVQGQIQVCQDCARICSKMIFPP